MMRFFRFLLDLLFPPRCAVCRAEGSFLCAACVGHFCKQPLSGRRLKPNWEQEWKHLNGVIYALNYEKNPSLRPAVAQFKYHFTQELADHFAALMEEKLRELFMRRGRQAVLIPVPLHKKRMAYRGFNQAQALAEKIAARAAGHATVLPLLCRTRHTSQQARLAKAERHHNLQDAFALVDPRPLPTQLKDQGIDLESAIFFVVDDVCTTGATLESSAQTLKAAGIPRVYGLVLARVT